MEIYPTRPVAMKAASVAVIWAGQQAGQALLVRKNAALMFHLGVDYSRPTATISDMSIFDVICLAVYALSGSVCRYLDTMQISG